MIFNKLHQFGLGCRYPGGQRSATHVTEIRRRSVDSMAVRTLVDRYHTDRFVIPWPDPVPFEDFIINVLVAQVGIDADHIGRETSPHHQFDRLHAISQLQEVGDPSVPEEMGCDVFWHHRPLSDFFDLFGDPGILQGSVS